ncbi:flavin reductase-like protein, FlaRed superfamily [Psychroflexus gondwanensis ACAM 44]|uniref:Flavin reductase-like protein, FlaRed superfamily n=1 Tax=Psychroflexus gondwanensis ACAM 44 TaxID=1189619 RepID=N1WYC9_9FLAO|nr:flavin reductase family protein [Psychroflexus gondwanensis]EMY82109.1 flavin reductase-like protein, FlaRed superfamily [Psychroflexus gondwanensis ACAM 44]
MKSFLPSELETKNVYGMLSGSIGPRPIAFASTVDENGVPNLSPYSFFNVFSANPPILIFSPVRRVRDNSIKHTLENAIQTKEVVINVVNWDMVQQMSLSSTEYDQGINEFTKSGLTMLKSDLVTPPRVKESPVQFECKVNETIALGKEGGAGNLIIAEVIKIHIREDLLDEGLHIDQHKIDLVSRMGGNWYSRANQGMFEVEKPVSKTGIGVDQLPESVRLSSVLTGNNLGQLGNLEYLPTERENKSYINENELEHLVKGNSKEQLHATAQDYIEKNELEKALHILLAKQ